MILSKTNYFSSYLEDRQDNLRLSVSFANSGTQNIT